VLAFVTLAATLHAQIEMPDPKQMSGIPRPVTDLPSGSISVRVIKGDLSNNIPNQPVELHIGDTVQTVKTDENGRAQFDNVSSGTVKAITVVEGERLESQEFPAPAGGGIRLMLVATDLEKEKQKAADAAAPAISGMVVLSGESRIVIEPGDQRLDVYYILEIVNTARVRVNPPAVFEFEMPKGTRTANILRGSSQQVSTTGMHVRVVGPFAPGKTVVQIAGDIPVESGTLNIVAKFPAIFEQPVVIMKKDGDMKLVSPQLDRQQETTTEGANIIIGAGNALPAGSELRITLTGLAHHSPLPRQIALVLTGLIVAAGVWAVAVRRRDTEGLGAERKRLVARREKLLQDLVRLEQDHRKGKVDEGRYRSRREELIAQLENVYGALDSDDFGPEPAGRTGVAA
jgi:hypothetical protein